MSESYPIEKGVPMPDRCACLRRSGACKYPVRALKRGDSFLVPETDAFKNLVNSVRNRATEAGITIAARRVEGGIRFWRIK